MKRINIIAHRGASVSAMENTLEAFNKAWEEGADGIEADFMLSADKQIICFHDLNGRRLLGKPLRIKSQTLATLRNLSENAQPPFYLPTLKEVMATVPAHKKFYIELKSGAHIVPFLYRELREGPLAMQQLMIISFHKAVIRELKKKMPDVKACWIRQFRRSQKTGEIQPNLKDLKMILKEIGADGLSSNQKYVTKALVQDLNNAGFEHHCWTVDDPQRALLIAQTGCQSITSNTPEKLAQLFAKNGKEAPDSLRLINTQAKD